MADDLHNEAAAMAANLYLMPYPRSVSMRGAPFRPAPANFLYMSANATVGTRRRMMLLCQQLYEIGFRAQPETSAHLGPTQALFTPSATFPKLDGMDRPLRAQAAAREGYRLLVQSSGVLLHGADEQGLQYAGATLRQLIQDGPEIPGMEIEDHPLLPYRAIHLDFKGWAPNFDYLKHTISTLADLKINVIILEYEAYFNFPSQPGLASEGAFAPTEIAELDLYAQDLGVTLVPLTPCFGNVGHILRLPAYAALREHSEYFQQFNPTNPEALGIVTAMIEDLASIHHGRLFHIGGDEARLLGSHPDSETRAKQLGGRAALYLEYIGKVCRYLISGQRNPMVWDDMFRRMTDEQVKWLPQDAILTFWQYEGHGGHATPAILTNLDRYKRLGRRVWGAATRAPAARYDSFDNIDAWTEAAEMGYLEGLITTVWTRDHTLGPMFAPAETAWPGAYYAAERVWSGLKGLAREQFPKRFVTRAFGIKDPTQQQRAWTGFDLIFRDHARKAREYFHSELKHAVRNKPLLAFMEAWTAIGSFKEYIKQFENDIANNFSNLQAGCGDPFHSGRLRWRILDAKQKMPTVIGNFQHQALRLTHERQVQEFLECSIAYNMKKLDDMESLLANYPLPPAEWQQPVQV